MNQQQCDRPLTSLDRRDFLRTLGVGSTALAMESRAGSASGTAGQEGHADDLTSYYPVA
jgi:hypothetical protein